MKKLLSLLLILLLSVTLMSGCFKKADEAAVNDTTTNDVVDSTDETQADTDEFLEDETEEDADLESIDDGSDSTGLSSSSKKTDSTTAASYEEESTSGSKTSGSKTSGSTGSKTDSGTSASYEEEDTTPAPKPTTPKPSTPPADTVTAPTQTVASTNAAFKTGISKSGSWIIATLKNLTFTEDLVLDGEFKNGKGAVQRKIALYTQDENHVVQSRFKLTAPTLTVNSPNARIQAGYFIGDVYANLVNFELVDAQTTGDIYVTGTGFKMSKNSTVNGNVFFLNKAAYDSRNIIETADDKSVVTGVKELAVVDTTTGASIIKTNDTTGKAAFLKAIGKTGEWIICTETDLIFDHELVLEGTFIKSGTSVQRKIGPYTQTKVDGKNVVVDRFTITTPKLTIKSPNAKFQGGILKGDLYIESLDFQLADATIDGNVYFANEAVKNSFVNTGTITGTQSIK